MKYSPLVIVLLLVVLPPLVCSVRVSAQQDDYRTVHRDAIVVDTHNDVPQRMLAGEDIGVRTSHGHSDLPRFLEGGVDVQVFSIWVPPDKKRGSYYEQANEQIDSVEAFIRRYPGRVGLARSSGDIDRLLAEGKFVVMLGMEGGHPIEDDVRKLEHFYRRGVRYMTLTWNNSPSWASSAADEAKAEGDSRPMGLTAAGKAIIRRMNELGMIIDISHVGEQAVRDVLEATTKPIIASHSSAWRLTPHRRNLKDPQLKAIAKNGGMVCINFNPDFIDSSFPGKQKAVRERNAPRIDSLRKAKTFPTGLAREDAIAKLLHDDLRAVRPSLKTLIDHFDHVAKLIGVDHVGIGSDFDGIGVTPLEMDDVTYLPYITRELLQRGYSTADVRKILGENFLRVLKANEQEGNADTR